MNARSVARELALLCFSQLSKKANSLENKDYADIVVSSIRMLADNAANDLKTTAGALIKMKEFIENYEIEHPDNLKRPIDALNIPVPLPMTSDMAGRVEELIDVADKSLSALELAEASALAEKKDVQDFIKELISKFVANKDAVENQIKEHSKDWDIKRIIRIDKAILSLAITELFYIEDIPVASTVDEYIELAKKYCSEEAPSFINGVLRGVIDGSEELKAKK